jgi:2-(1,2-epoxy-1,2-dihydrophenyl)acetyl-CoA isomerase
MNAVRYEVVDAVATVTLNRTDSLNSMNVELLDDLVSALGRVQGDEAVRVVVLTGAGRGFCSGADLSQQWEDMPTGPNEAVRLLASMPVPTIAKVQGVAAGGGVGLALSCDVTIAARSTRFLRDSTSRAITPGSSSPSTWRKVRPRSWSAGTPGSTPLARRRPGSMQRRPGFLHRPWSQTPVRR